jgi:O-antigen ligase
MSAVAPRWHGSPRQQAAVVVLLLPFCAIAGAAVSVMLASFGAGKVVWVLAIMLGGIWAMHDARRTAAVLALALAFPFRTKLLFGLEVHTTHLLLAAIAGLGMLELALRRRQVPRGLIAPLAVMTAGAVIASLAGPYSGGSLLRTGWGIALPVLAALVLSTTLRTGHELRAILLALAVGVAGESLIALAQAAGKAPAIFPSWEAHRAVGLFLHPNILGSFFAASILVLAAVATMTWRERPVTAAALLGAILVGLGGLVATESRGAFIGLLAGTAALLALLAIGRHGLAALSMLATVFLILFIAVPRLPETERAQFAKRIEQLRRPGSEAGRERIYAEARHVIGDYPLTGVGPLTFGAIGSRRSSVPGIECCLTHAHNVFLEAYLSIGPIGLVGLLWLGGGSVKRLIRLGCARRGTISSGWAVGVLAALVALVVAGMFDFVFWQPEMVVLLLVFLVSGYALHAPGNTSPAPRRW